MNDGLRGRIRLVPVLLALVLILAGGAHAEEPLEVDVFSDESGRRLQVGGEDFMVLGMNWGYMPIGENYTYDFWGKPDDFIKDVLAVEMPMLQAMHVNTIRQYVGIPKRWIEYIYDTYGIWTVLNHPLARWGLTIDGVWYPNTDYSSPRVREIVLGENRAMAEEFKGTRGLLMYLLGNENNYGLSWSSFEIEALPEGERNAAKARYLYSLYGETIDVIKSIDTGPPVGIANGDLQYIDLIAEECPNLDVMGSNVYRGISARDFFQVIEDKLGVPAYFTEFGADAFNARTMGEDQAMQAKYLIGQWQEIYEQSAGKGRVGNAIGGLIFQWSDGWWKFKQEERLDIHDTNASWPNGAYPEDFVEGDNNMNEEWWGICAKGYNDSRGMYQLYPRAAYYALADAFSLDAYAPTTDLGTIRRHFGRITPTENVIKARGDKAALSGETSKVRVAGVRMEFETYSTGGKNTTTPPVEMPQTDSPSYKGFDHTESYYVDIEAKPSEAVIGRLSLNVLGNVASNPIDEIFYENRGSSRRVADVDGEEFDMDDLERLAVYSGTVTWDDRWFMLNAFYRVGHLHWQYEGDFFGLYRDGFYGENLDIYNGRAPLGFEIEGKKALRGLKVAFGPELWWGANPALLMKYQRRVGSVDWTAMFQEDFAQQTSAVSSFAIPVQTTRKAALSGVTKYRGFDIEAGVLWSGQPRVGDSFQMIDDDALEADALTAADIRQDEITDDDTWGFKTKLMYQKGRYNWYGQGAYMGLVSEAGPTMIPTYTGWTLKESGSGNQTNVITGLAVGMGTWQIGPNFLWQKPIVGPMAHPDGLTGTPGRARNTLDDPFAVRWNRETTAGELMLVYDPTPATWFWMWDNDIREDANLAASIGISLRKHHTSADAGLFVAADGNIYPFPGGSPARDWGDLWEVNCRVVNKVGDSARMVSRIVFGAAEGNSERDRLIQRFSVDSRIAWPSVAFQWFAKFNDFGPYDYHRDFSQTYPMQLMGDLSVTLGRPVWFDYKQTRLGVRALYRTLDRFSPRYAPEGVPVPVLENELYPEGLDEGREWEIRTYLHLAL